MLTYTKPTIDDLLGNSIASLDIPDGVHRLAVARYQAVAQALERRWQSGSIYPQGSFRLGTAVRPIHAEGEYDIDLVCRREIETTSTTQETLKADVGVALAAFAASNPEGSPKLSEGKRCWTLDYPSDPFHLDALPAIPDKEAHPDGILLTDRNLHEWQHSNPIAYSDWFYAVIVKEFTERREVLAKRMQVDDVPEWQVKTTLQRAVQALKRHRDIYFIERADDAPASIIITTLAARAYARADDLLDVITSVVGRMPQLVEVRNGVYWVANPVQPQENFADRWQSNPKRAEAFFEWIAAAHNDFASIGEASANLDRVLTRIAKSLGDDAAKGGGAALGNSLRDARDRGELKMAPRTGALAVGAAPTGIPVRRHTFHGDSA
jgi:hypothetical protein